MILLTDKEIFDLMDEALGLPVDAIIFGRDIAKAQAELDEQENVDATTDYAEGKISTERWAERLGVDVYDLYAALNKYGRSLNDTS